jgi:hypothetical protein
MAKRRALVTLTTDFGLVDPYVAAMKGTILQHCPYADIVDISHDIPPQQVLSAAFVLANSAPCFPKGTLHVVVVDPGVGTGQSILLARFGGQMFLFPDNGVITIIKQILPLEQLISVRNPDFLPRREVSQTFHGRDIFAPLAGEILMGADISSLGPTPRSYKLLDLPASHEEGEELVGCVIYVDHFGNLISNITTDDLRRRWGELDSLQIVCRGKVVGALAGTYGLVSPGESLALFNSMGLVEVAVNRGRACQEFKVGIGAEIRIRQKKFLEA